MATKERIHFAGIDIEWDDQGCLERWAGSRTLALWVAGTISGMMLGMQRMVGTERFNLSLQSGGRHSSWAETGDWNYIQAHPTFDEGFEALTLAARVAGWGLWRIQSLDYEKKEARFSVEKGWEAFYQQDLGVCWGSSMQAGKFAGLCSKLFGVNCWAEQTMFAAKGDPYDEFVVRPSDQTVETQLENLLGTDHATRADLAVALEKLRQEVQERKQIEEKLKTEIQERKQIEQDKLDLIRKQQEIIKQMATPIIQVWEGILTVPVIGILSGERVSEMMDQLLREIVRTQCKSTIIDLTGVEEVDAHIADHLIRIVRAVELMGARSIITGIRPAVAQTMISIGVDLTQLTTLSNLQEGLKACMKP